MKMTNTLQADLQPLPISVCMISGAEAERIRRALESVAPLAREIIVVLNAEVNDGTEEIALKFGAKVFREPWKGFTGQKNSATEKATGDWVLGLDADEAVSPDLAVEIRQALGDRGRLNGTAAFSFPRLSWYFGRWIRHGDWYPDRQTRLWRRGQAHWSGIDPHASLEVSGRTVELHGSLHHYTSDTINRQVIKTMNYADDFARYCEVNQRHITGLDLVVRPGWRFARAYIFKLGFLDGWQGYTIAWLTAFYTFLRYARAREAQLKLASPK
jgi:glycosyltransferase involved in cell wall biosynthesis